MNKLLRFLTPTLAVLVSGAGGAIIYREATDYSGWCSIVIIVVWSLLLGAWFWDLAYPSYWTIYQQGRLDEAREIKEMLDKADKESRGRKS